jgi:diadenosine tetraphosphate (Ap4A) HIT family hydrolase
MGNACCELRLDINRYRVVCETPNFFVMPTLGSMGIEGYLLIITKEHHLGFGMIPQSQHAELAELISELKGRVKDEYGKSCLIFEHGPRIGGTEPGKSIDHSHLHLVPGVDIVDDWAVDMMHRLGRKGQFYRVDRVEGFEKARELCLRGSSYLYVDSPQGMQLLSEQNFHRPSQYFRTMVAHQVEVTEWNWKENNDLETLLKTVQRLQGKIFRN